MKLQPTRLRKVAVALTLASFAASTTLPARASIQSEMNEMYRGLRALPGDVADGLAGSVQINAPGAFHGQTYHTYMGGSVFQRTPIRNLQLASIDMPHFSAGCGGIDMHFGSISHLDGSKIVDFLRAVAMNMGGVITQVALGAITPLLASKLEWAKDVVDKINGFNLNSCQVAKSAVAGGMNAVTMSDNADCIEYKMVHNGLNIDEARSRCQSSAGQNNTLRDARAAGDGLVSFKGNLTWEALKKVEPALAEDEREMIMSLIGSWVFHVDDAPRDGTALPAGGGAGAPPGPTTGGAADSAECAEGAECGSKGRMRDDSDGMASNAVSPVPIFPTISDIPDFLLGNGSDGAPAGFVNVSMYNCPNAACLNPTASDRQIESLSERVAADLHSIADHIRDRQPLTQRQVSLMNQTSLPVWKMLSLGTQIQGSGMADLMIETYKDVIAADYAYTVLGRAMKAGQAALHQKFKFNTYQEKHIIELLKSASEKMTQIKNEHDKAQAKVGNIAAVSTTLETLERQLRAQMPQQVVDLLSQSGVRGQR